MKKLEYRGYDSTGGAFFQEDGQFVLKKKVGAPSKVIAELDKLKTIFASKIKDHEKATNVDQNTILRKRKDNIQEILKVLRKQKAQCKKKANKGPTGYDMLIGKTEK